MPFLTRFSGGQGGLKPNTVGGVRGSKPNILGGGVRGVEAKISFGSLSSSTRPPCKKISIFTLITNFVKKYLVTFFLQYI